MDKAKLNEQGHEVVDSTPMAPPLGFKKQPTMVDHIRNMVRSELLAREVRAAGFETAEEADDFEVEDDPIDPTTPYEEHFEPHAEPARAPSGGAPATVEPVKPADVAPAAAAPSAPVAKQP